MREACEVGGRDGPGVNLKEVERGTSRTVMKINHPRHCRSRREH